MKTNNIARYIFPAGAVLAMMASAAVAEEATPAFTTRLDVAYVSKYVWRGLVANPDGAIQPSLTVAHSSGLSLNLWGSWDTTDVAGAKNQFTEHDYNLNYAWDCNGKACNAGYVYYAFPNTSLASTSEVYGSLCFGGPLATTLSVNYDVDEASGFYAALSGGYSLPIGINKTAAPTLNLTGKVGVASASYNKFYCGVDDFALVDATVGASVPYTINSKWSVTPAVSYSMLIDKTLRDAVGKPDNLVGSLTLSCAF